MNIKLKLFSIFLLTSFLMLAFGAFAFLSVQKISKETKVIAEREVPIARCTREALIALLKTNGAFERILLVEDISGINQIAGNEAILKKAVIRFDMFMAAITWGSKSQAFFKDSAGIIAAEWERAGLDKDFVVEQASPEQVQFTGQANVYFAGYVGSINKSINDYKKALRLESIGQSDEARDLKRQSSENRAKAIDFLILTIEVLDKTALISNNNIVIATNDVKRIERIMNTLLLSVSVFVFAGSLLAGNIFTAIVIGRPLSLLMQAVRDITAGNLLRKAEVTSKDEIGELAVSFNEMTAQLRGNEEKLEGQVATRTAELQKAVNELKEKNIELEKIQKITMGRELRMIELKEKIKELESKIPDVK